MSAKSLFVFGFSAALAVFATDARAESIPDQYKTGEFFIGCQAYSFKEYKVFAAIEKTAQCGGKVIEFFPGQALSAETVRELASWRSAFDIDIYMR